MQEEGESESRPWLDGAAYHVLRVFLQLLPLGPIGDYRPPIFSMKSRGPLLAVKTKLQSQLIWLVFLSMAVPTLILGGLVSTHPVIALAGPIPEEMRGAILLGIVVLGPVLAAVFLCWAFHLTNRMVGPVDRMDQELDARLRGTASGPIVLRPNDLLLPLAEKINLVVADWEKVKKALGS